jgi:hypothetical protein
MITVTHEIKWNNFHATKPGSTTLDYLVATTDPNLAPAPDRPVVVCAGYGANQKFYYEGEQVTQVYAWASMPTAPLFDAG